MRTLRLLELKFDNLFIFRSKLTALFDGVVKLGTNGDYDFNCHVLLNCVTLVKFDRICLIDPSSVVNACLIYLINPQ